MLETKEREIRGAVYQCTTLPARRALKVGTKLAKLIGPSLGALGDGFNLATGEAIAGQGGVISRAVKMLVEQMTETKIESMILELLDGTIRIDPKSNTRQEVSTPAVFDEVYSGNFAELGGALVFALETSLGDFFGEGSIGGLISRATSKADKLLSQSDSPAASMTNSSKSSTSGS